MDKFRDMELLCSVVEKGNFAKAAKAIGVTPAIVGRRISALEDKLGLVLFQRTTRSMQLTHAGKSYYEGAKQLLEQVEHLEHSLTQEHQDNPSGLIRLSAPDELGRQFLIHAIAKFQKSYPDIHFDLSLNNSPVNLIDEDIDLAFRLSFDMQDSSHVAVKLSQTSLGLYASPRYIEDYGVPEDIQALQSHRCIQMGSSRYGSSWNLEKNGQRINHRQAWALTVSNTSSLFEALLSDMGIAMVPTMFCHKYVEQGRLVLLEGISDFPEVGVYAIYPTRKHLPYRLKIFLNFLKGWFEG